MSAFFCLVFDPMLNEIKTKSIHDNQETNSTKDKLIQFF